ncbi:hypothetical protein [Pseudosulfitobacter sp. DSM 107133]|jgi:flagellar assembly protein FliH|uniref:hypothetical protein n=1 Tax=Pseudosulfitobacter sp. DSM 107133 TaxID=2883100 RepID=UPI000DF30C98|nr:hypothetical protein [Pseudosulfitobacter sp. DSM 107133]
MMSLLHLYREFGEGESDSEVAASTSSSISQEALEDIKLEAFESGYSAGWEDALKAQSDSQTETVNAFVATLQDVSFGYHEARAGLIKAMQPVLSDIINKLLPEVAQAALGAQVVEQLTSMLRKSVNQDIRIEATQTNLEMLEKLVGHVISAPFVCVPNSDLGPNQIILQVGAQENEIDLDQVISGVANAMAGFVQQMKRELTS